MKLWLRLHGFEPCSWTFVWENLREAFLSLGDEVCDMGQPMPPEEFVEVWWGDPQFWRWSTLPVKARIALALSEARSILAKGRSEVIANLRMADLVICPSEAATTAFRESPIETPMKVALFGADPEILPVIKRNWTSKITFLHAGVTQMRKGSWLVPEAFIKAFNGNHLVELIIASPRSSPMFTRLKGEYGNHPQMKFISNLTESPMELYKQAHIYVSPHLSEGFGLMVAEAMSTGMPGIVSRCSAPREFFHQDFGFWVEMDEFYLPVAACLPDTAGFWRIPDIQSLIKAMTDAYEDRIRCETAGSNAAKYIREQLTWKHTALAIKQHIKEVLSEKNISDHIGIQRGEVTAVSSEEHRAAC